MNIVVLDGYAANHGDLCWDELQALGECTIYDRTAPAEVLERAAGAEILLTNKTVLTAEHMAALPELKTKKIQKKQGKQSKPRKVIREMKA